MLVLVQESGVSLESRIHKVPIGLIRNYGPDQTLDLNSNSPKPQSESKNCELVFQTRNEIRQLYQRLDLIEEEKVMSAS